MDPQPERKPDLQRQPATPEPRIQRLGRDEPLRKPPDPPKPPEAQAKTGGQEPPRRNWGIGRLLAITLLFVSGGLMIGGRDEKPEPPPVPHSVTDMAESVPDEIVVDFKDDTSDAQIQALGQTLGIQFRYNTRYAVPAKLTVAKINPTERAGLLAALRANPLVEAAEPQHVGNWDQEPKSVTSTRFVPNDPMFKRQWNLAMLGMEETWTRTKGKGATVAIIDSGVGGISAAGAYIQGQDFTTTEFVKGHDFGVDAEIPADTVGHGTHVSGTVAESTDNGVFGAGIAPEAKIMPLKTAGRDNKPVLSAVADSLRYAADHGANIANMSLGMTPSPILESAVKYAYRKGVTLVCSAGNTGKEGVGYPGRYKECIAVSAVGPTGQKTSYSTWGKEVDIAAPGGDPTLGKDAEIWQNTFLQRSGVFGPSGPRVDGYYPMSGTSMAAPHVTAVAALLYSQGIKDPVEIRSQLRKTVKPKTPAEHYGAGILDANAATKSIHRATRYNWVQLGIAAAAAALLFSIGRNLRQPTDSMFFVHHVAIALAVGLFFPIALEKVLGFGNWWNLVGHSVLLAILFMIIPGLDRSGFWKAFAFTLGLVLHLFLDSDSGKTPFLVIPQSRILFWLYANIAVGLYFLFTTYRTVSARIKAARLAA